MRTIAESGVLFGEFAPERLFVIENSDVHKNAGKGIKTVEFIYLTEDDNLVFLEAKQSCPNAESKEDTKEKQKKYEEYFREITDKFVDSINMFAAAVMDRNPESDSIGEILKQKNVYTNVKFKWILVVTNAMESWLPGPKAELEQRLLKFRKIWKADILVLNKEMAIKYGLAIQ